MSRVERGSRPTPKETPLTSEDAFKKLPLKAMLYLAYGEMRNETKDTTEYHEYSKQQLAYLQGMNNDERAGLVEYLVVRQGERERMVKHSPIS